MPPIAAARIRHAVAFRLVHRQGSPEEAEFLGAVAALRRIDGVEAFELLREVSPKNDFSFALTMEFADEEAYRAYDRHPDHVAFVGARWASEVADFLELDTVALD
jgi:heme-degrading monooxygenase HmoA